MRIIKHMQRTPYEKNLAEEFTWATVSPDDRVNRIEIMIDGHSIIIEMKAEAERLIEALQKYKDRLKQ
jgi:hypothetical protein